MAALLFPGRHHLLTNFQLSYLTRLVSGSLDSLRDATGCPIRCADQIDTIVWAVTSANHSNTRRNPLPAHRREAAIEEFSTQLDADSFVFLIDDIGQTERFADYLLKKIEVDSQGRLHLTPDNTLVGCSTPEVMDLYERLGFQILPFELVDRANRVFCAATPSDLVQWIVEIGLEGRDWRVDERFVREVSRASRRMLLKYDYGSLIVDLHRALLLTDDGDLTETRDYNTYVRSFDEGVRRKYELIRDLVQPGRIVDIGCCSGALIRELTQDDRLRESDFFGIEVTRQLYAECQHRKEQGAFGDRNVFFYQKDFAAGPVFATNSIDVFLTFAVTHEIESYSGRQALQNFIRLLHDQLAIHGRWLNVDVVGPDNAEEIVYLWLNREDGRNQDFEREFDAHQRMELRDYLDGLSTYARFLRFTRDFRREEGDQIEYQLEDRGDQEYVVLKLREAAEFLTKKDYTDNWQSEMHETFCFWRFSDWQEAVTKAGFRVLPASHAYLNPWIVETRYRGKARLFRSSGTELEPLEFPVTNMLLVAERLY